MRPPRFVRKERYCDSRTDAHCPIVSFALYPRNWLSLTIRRMSRTSVVGIQLVIVEIELGERGDVDSKRLILGYLGRQERI